MGWPRVSLHTGHPNSPPPSRDSSLPVPPSLCLPDRITSTVMPPPPARPICSVSTPGRYNRQPDRPTVQPLPRRLSQCCNVQRGSKRARMRAEIQPLTSTSEQPLRPQASAATLVSRVCVCAREGELTRHVSTTHRPSPTQTPPRPPSRTLCPPPFAPPTSPPALLPSLSSFTFLSSSLFLAVVCSFRVLYPSCPSSYSPSFLYLHFSVSPSLCT